jgi:hypothetical protein
MITNPVRRGLGIFLFDTIPRPALGPTQPPIQQEPGALSLEVKLPGREADHLSPSSAEVKECVDLYFHSPNTRSWHCAYLSTETTFPFHIFPNPVCICARKRKKEKRESRKEERVNRSDVIVFPEGSAIVICFPRVVSIATSDPCMVTHRHLRMRHSL